MTTETINTPASGIIQKGKAFVEKCQTNFSKGIIIGLTAFTLGGALVSCGPSIEELQARKDQDQGALIDKEKSAKERDHEAWVESQKARTESKRTLKIRQQLNTLHENVYRDSYCNDYPDHKLSMTVDDGKIVFVNFKTVYAPDFSEGRLPVIEIKVTDGTTSTDGFITFQNSNGTPGGPWDVITVKVFVGDKLQTEESCDFESENFTRVSTGTYLSYLNDYAEKLIAQYPQNK